MSSAPAVVTWSTDAVDAIQRVDYYADALSSAITPMRMERLGDARQFRADMTMADLGLVTVLRQSGTAHRCFRDRSDLARANERTYHLCINLTSRWDVTHRTTTRLEPGDAIFVDSALGSDMRLEASYDVAHIKFSEAWVRQWLPSPGVLVGRRIPATSGWGRALTSFAAQLAPEFVTESPLPVSVVADHVGALLALCAAESTGRPAASSTRGVTELCTRIEDCIAQRCTEPSLSAQQVAASANVSLRTLHRCLSIHKKSFGALLIGARADLAIRMLESPLFRRLTLAEIGRRAGFVDPSHFARVLRARTGRTPSQMRRRSDESPMTRETDEA